jgi:hypothetical protein
MHYLEAIEKLAAGSTQCLTWVKTSDKEPICNDDLDLLVRRTADFADCVFAIARYDGTWWIQYRVDQPGSGWVEMETPPEYWADLTGKQ